MRGNLWKTRVPLEYEVVQGIWSTSSASLNTARGGQSCVGSDNNMVSLYGQSSNQPLYTNVVTGGEYYNGSAWSNISWISNNSVENSCVGSPLSMVIYPGRVLLSASTRLDTDKYIYKFTGFTMSYEGEMDSMACSTAFGIPNDAMVCGVCTNFTTSSFTASDTCYKHDTYRYNAYGYLPTAMIFASSCGLRDNALLTPGIKNTSYQSYGYSLKYDGFVFSTIAVPSSTGYKSTLSGSANNAVYMPGASFSTSWNISSNMAFRFNGSTWSTDVESLSYLAWQGSSKYSSGNMTTCGGFNSSQSGQRNCYKYTNKKGKTVILDIPYEGYWYNSSPSGTLGSSTVTWSTGSSMKNARVDGVAVGASPTSLVIWGGTVSNNVVKTAEKVTSSAFATTGSLPETVYKPSGSGTAYNAAISFGGSTDGSGTYTLKTYKFGGSSWSTLSDFLFDQIGQPSCGSLTDTITSSGLGMGKGMSYNSVFKFNGSVWSFNSNNISRITAMAGTSTAAIALGDPPSIVKWNGGSFSLKFDGTTWRVGNFTPHKVYNDSISGTQIYGITNFGLAWNNDVFRTISYPDIGGNNRSSVGSPSAGIVAFGGYDMDTDTNTKVTQKTNTLTW